MVLKRIPSLNWLRVFEAAARTGSFVGAGQVLGMSAAAVSKQIKALESHLGQPLFQRSAHGVTLTQAGFAFAPSVREALLSVEATANSMFGERQVTPLNIYLPYILGSSWLACRVGAFEAAHPNIRLQLLGYAPAPGMLAPSQDLQITYGPSASSWGDHDRLFGETLHAVATPEIAARIRQPADLLRYRLIDIGAHRAGWLRLLATAGLGDGPPPQFSYTDSTPMALSLAVSGLGIALARAPATDYLETRLGLVRCLPEFTLTTEQAYFLLYPSRQNLNPAARRFREWLLEAAAA